MYFVSSFTANFSTFVLAKHLMVKHFIIAIVFLSITLKGFSCNAICVNYDSLNKIEYHKTIAEADSIFEIAHKNKDFDQLSNCKQLYVKANRFYPSSPYPQQKVDEINSILRLEPVEGGCGNYSKIVDKANELFEKKDYVNALKLYDRAHSLKPSDPFNVQRINEIEEILKNLNK
jgi:tetratricopeptide (TPR) repeat protein